MNTLPEFSERAELAPLDLITLPVWIFDVERRSLWWANRAAAQLCADKDAKGLSAREWGDMPEVVATRLSEHLERFRLGERTVEPWTWSVGEDACSRTFVCSRIVIESGRAAILVQGTPTLAAPSGVDAFPAVEALRDSEWKYRSVINNTGEGFWMLDVAGRTVEVNDSLCALLGYQRSEMLGRSPLEFVDDENRAIFATQMARIPDTEHRRYEIALRRRDGINIPTRFNTTTLWREDGGIYGAFAFVSDLTEQRRTEAALTRLSSATEHSGSAIAILEGDGRVQYVNPRFTEMTGFAASEVVGQPFQSLRTSRTGAMREITRALAARRSWRGQALSKRRDGSDYWALISVNPVAVDGGERIDFVVVCEDITALVEAQLQAERLSFFDPLTGLANRRLFIDRLDRAVRTARREQTAAALLYLDLDRFKEINDTFGHEWGDRVLRKVAARLSAAVRDEDTVSRLGGDEFTVILRRVDRERGVAVVAEKLLRLLNEPIELDGQQVVVGSSVGIAMIPPDGSDVESLMRNADRAMYQAKAAGRGTYCFFSPMTGAVAGKVLQIEQQLRQALEQEQFVLHFQPLISLATGRVTSVEALLRWRHPDRGLLLPDEFVPVAEQSGLIVPMGAWVLQSACRHMRALWAAGVVDCGVSVNLSARQLSDDKLLQTVSAAIDQSGIAPHLLELELTESAVMENLESAIDTLRMLKSLGVTISIDDFGTGHSSLASLKRLPIDTLKIDRSFIHDIPASSDDLAITSAIIAMAHKLGLKVVAEGVETAPQRDFLTRLACETGQGFLFSTPIPPEQLPEYLRSLH